MNDITRRQFAAMAGSALALPAIGTGFADAAAAPRVVVIGGGFGGATFCKYLRRSMKGVRITLVEPKASYVSCVYSNEVLVGQASLKALTVRYKKFARKYRIRHMRTRAEHINPAKKRVRLASGKTLRYDKLVISPGIDFRYDAITGWNQATEKLLPSAWHAGPETTALYNRLKAMPSGGTAIVTIPPMPYRCPPAPYERASLIAWYLKQYNPSAKVLVLDSNDTFPKQALFEEGWSRLVPGMVTRISGSDGGEAQSVDPSTMAVGTAAGTFSGDFVNIIPPQQAGEIARTAGLVSTTGWCPVDSETFESLLVDDIHVLGDSAATGLPKSGTSANAGAKVAAMAMSRTFKGKRLKAPVFINTCYSKLAPDYAIGIASVFGLDKSNNITVRHDGTGTSPLNESLGYRREEAEDADKWFRAMLADTFA